VLEWLLFIYESWLMLEGSSDPVDSICKSDQNGRNEINMNSTYARPDFFNAMPMVTFWR
jgi:hypothetical protein